MTEPAIDEKTTTNIAEFTTSLAINTTTNAHESTITTPIGIASTTTTNELIIITSIITTTGTTDQIKTDILTTITTPLTTSSLSTIISTHPIAETEKITTTIQIFSATTDAMIDEPTTTNTAELMTSRTINTTSNVHELTISTTIDILYSYSITTLAHSTSATEQLRNLTTRISTSSIPTNIFSTQLVNEVTSTLITTAPISITLQPFQTTLSISESNNVFYIITAIVIGLAAILVLLVYAFINYKLKSNKSKVAPINDTENFKIEEESTV
jgi:hypothetical protein